MLDIIKWHITVITDCWHAYDQVDLDGWQHLTIYHQYNFVGKNLVIVSHTPLGIIVKYTEAIRPKKHISR